MRRLLAAIRPEDEREAVFVVGVILLAIGFALWWIPAAFIVPGAILTLLGVFSQSKGEVPE